MKFKPYCQIIVLFINTQLLFSCIAYSQHSDIDSIVNSHYTVIPTDSLIQRNLLFWKPYYDNICDEANIERFDSSKGSIHFRLYGSSQIIDVQELSSGKFLGILYHWAREVVPSEEPSTNRVYCLQQPLKDQQTQSLLKLWSSTGMDTLPDQKKIKGWDTGLDGVVYVLESIENRKYKFRSYWSPHKGSSTAEERLVYQFVDSAFSLSDSKPLTKRFVDTIPFYSWQNGPERYVVKAVTWTEYRAMKRERKQYRKSIHRLSE